MDQTCPAKPTLYFDGACPVCAREVAMYRSQPGAEAVEWVDITRSQPVDLGPGLSPAMAMERLHLRRPDGSLVSGAEAFTELWKSLPRWSWLGRLMGSGVALRLLEAGYRGFLAVRPLWRKVDARP